MIPEALIGFLEERPPSALAFSGGCDSTYLLYVCSILKADVVPYFVRGSFQTQEEEDSVREICGRYGFVPSILQIDTLSDADIAANTSERCYLCKRRVFSLIKEASCKEGRSCIMDGTNASDDPAGRPGMRVLDEMGIVSPLRVCGITKDEVRRLSREAGIPDWDKPSDSCLATRIPVGTPITGEALERTYRAEKAIRALGLRGIRVRTVGKGAKLETDPEQRDLLESNREEVEKILLKYYDSVSYGERRPL